MQVTFSGSSGAAIANPAQGDPTQDFQAALNTARPAVASQSQALFYDNERNPDEPGGPAPFPPGDGVGGGVFGGDGIQKGEIKRRIQNSWRHFKQNVRNRHRKRQERRADRADRRERRRDRRADRRDRRQDRRADRRADRRGDNKIEVSTRTRVPDGARVVRASGGPMRVTGVNAPPRVAPAPAPTVQPPAMPPANPPRILPVDRAAVLATLPKEVQDNASWLDTVVAGIVDGADSFADGVTAAVQYARDNPAAAGHVALDLLGMVPVYGEWADALNASWYFSEGNYKDAALSAFGVIPVVGWAGPALRYVEDVASRYADNIADAAGGGLRIFQEGGQVIGGGGGRAATSHRITDAELRWARTKYNIPEGKNTIAIGRTDVPGFQEGDLFGASPEVRQIGVELPPPSTGSIDAPFENPAFRNHAEQHILNQFSDKVPKGTKLEGHTLQIHVSRDVCTHCRSGLLENGSPNGILKQFAKDYPDLEIHITIEGSGTEYILKGDSYIQVTSTPL